MWPAGQLVCTLAIKLCLGGCRAVEIAETVRMVICGHRPNCRGRWPAHIGTADVDKGGKREICTMLGWEEGRSGGTARIAAGC